MSHRNLLKRALRDTRADIKHLEGRLADARRLGNQVTEVRCIQAITRLAEQEARMFDELQGSKAA